MRKRTIAAAAPVAALAGIAVQDLVQKQHALRRNFPVVARLRYLVESIGPELRQYIITSNDEERPFSRDQRRWIYASSKKENNYFGFGSDNDTENSSYPIVKQATFSDVVRLRRFTVAMSSCPARRSWVGLVAGGWPSGPPRR